MPPASMQKFSGTYMELLDSSHTDVCKPVDKQHPAYKELLDFVEEILKNSKVLLLALINEVTLVGISLARCTVACQKEGTLVTD